MKWWHHLLCAAGALILIEGSLRLFWEVPTQLQYVSGVGLMPTPNSTWVQNSEGPHWTRVNERGLNTHTPPANTCTQVYIMGDSMVSAYEVPRADNFVSQVQNRLPHIAVVNAGFSGLSPYGWSAWTDYLNVTEADHLVVMLNWLDVLELTEEVPPALVEPQVHKYISAILSRSAIASTLVKKIGVGPFGPERYARDITQQDPLYIENALQQVLVQLQVRTPHISLVYLPDYSFAGRPLSVTRPNIDIQAEALVTQVSERVGLPLLNLSNDMAEAIRQTQRIPVGFNHGWPTRGHLNIYGHTMVAKTLTPWLQEKVSNCEVKP